MKQVLFITNIPAPYRIDFYNELGKTVDLTVIFEAKGASDQGIRFNWNIDEIRNFKAIFLSEGDIREKKIDWSIFKYLKVREYDEIVVTSYSYFTEMAALVYLKLRGVSYYMETDGGMIRTESKLKKWYKTFLISGAKGYFSPSKSSDEYLAYYGAKSNRIFRYPFTSMKAVDVLDSVITIEERSAYKKSIGCKERYMILGVGQFIHRKGWDVLMNAIAKMNTSCDTYIIGGGGTPSEYTDLLNQLNLTNIHFCGFKTKEQLQSYFKAADLFVLPTREDIWGLVINEALSYGLPVITTDAKIVHTCIPCTLLGMVREIITGSIAKIKGRKFILHCRYDACKLFPLLYFSQHCIIYAIWIFCYTLVSVCGCDGHADFDRGNFSAFSRLHVD